MNYGDYEVGDIALQPQISFVKDDTLTVPYIQVVFKAGAHGKFADNLSCNPSNATNLLNLQ